MQHTAIVLSQDSNNAKVYIGSDSPSVLFKEKTLVKNISVSSLAKAFSDIQYDIEMPLILSKTPPVNVVKITTVKNRIVYQIISDEFKTVVKYDNKQDRNNGINKVTDYKVVAPLCYWIFVFDEIGLLTTRLYHLSNYRDDDTTLYRFVIGNANPEVCWGDYKAKISKLRPKHIQGIISQFWSSIFNDDLTPFDPKDVFFTRGSLDFTYVQEHVSSVTLASVVQSLINNL